MLTEFKKDVGSTKKVQKTKTSGGLGSLSSIAKSKPKVKKTKAKYASISSIFDNIGSTSGTANTSEDKKDAAPSLMSSIFDTVKSKPMEEKDPNEALETNDKDDNKIQITKVFDFAGEEVK